MVLRRQTRAQNSATHLTLAKKTCSCHLYLHANTESTCTVTLLPSVVTRFLIAGFIQRSCVRILPRPLFQNGSDPKKNFNFDGIPHTTIKFSTLSCSAGTPGAAPSGPRHLKWKEHLKKCLYLCLPQVLKKHEKRAFFIVGNTRSSINIYTFCVRCKLMQ